MDTERLQKLAGIEKPEAGTNNELFSKSLEVVFGLDPDTVQQVVALVSRGGDVYKLSDQQVRRRAGTRAIALLQQAHDAAAGEGDVHYDEDPEDDLDDDPEADPVGDGMDDMPEDEGIEDTMDDEGAMDVENTDERR